VVVKRIVFYSWQSDLPNSSNRGFIQDALEIAAKAIAADESISVEPVIDRDTAGSPGAPDIAATIFGKIAGADLVIADISIVQKPRKGRPTPNPNVLIELGYALRAVGPERTLLVFNEAYGQINDLPFDLRMRRLITYEISGDAEEKAPERKALAKKFEAALRTAIAVIPTQVANAEADVFDAAVAAVENVEPKRTLLTRRSLDTFADRLDAGRPKLFRDGGTTEDLLAGLSQTQELIASATRLFDTIAVMGDEAGALEIFRWFGRYLVRCDLPAGFTGGYNNADFDFYKFVGNELFVSLIAAILRENNWGLLSRLLNEPFTIAYSRRTDGPKTGHWSDMSTHLSSMQHESQKRNRLSFHADVLKGRHSAGGGLEAVMPMDDYVAADFFLYLVGRISSTGHWVPWSAVFLNHPPTFLLAAERTSVANELVHLSDAVTIPDFKTKVATALEDLRRFFPGGFLHFGISRQMLDDIGTK
jgi:hypothetical protein